MGHVRWHGILVGAIEFIKQRWGGLWRGDCANLRGHPNFGQYLGVTDSKTSKSCTFLLSYLANRVSDPRWLFELAGAN